MSWEGAGRDDGELYRGARLELALDWLRDHPADPNAVEREFLETSRATAEASAASGGPGPPPASPQLRRRGRRGRRRARGGRALRSSSGAAPEMPPTPHATRRSRPESGRLAALGPTLAQTDLSLSMLLGVEAVRRGQTAESLGALQRTFVAADTSLGFLYSDEPLRAVFVDGDRIVGFGESTSSAGTPPPISASTSSRSASPSGTGAAGLHPVSYVKGIAAWVGSDDVARVVDLGAPTAAREVAGTRRPLPSTRPPPG